MQETALFRYISGSNLLVKHGETNRREGRCERRDTGHATIAQPASIHADGRMAVARLFLHVIGDDQVLHFVIDIPGQDPFTEKLIFRAVGSSGDNSPGVGIADAG